MKKAILATKVGMTQIFNDDGVLTPVTVLQAGPCVVTQVKTADNDGYLSLIHIYLKWCTASGGLCLGVAFVPMVKHSTGRMRCFGGQKAENYMERVQRGLRF